MCVSFIQGMQFSANANKNNMRKHKNDEKNANDEHYNYFWCGRSTVL